MQIVHTPMAGAFVTSKAEAQGEYDKANRAQLEAGALVEGYGKYLPSGLIAEFNGIEDWYIKNYTAFRRSSELSYSNWTSAANTAQDQYESFTRRANAIITKSADKIVADGGKPPQLEKPEKPLIPGLPAEANNWIIAGAVGIALLIGVKMIRK